MARSRPRSRSRAGRRRRCPTIACEDPVADRRLRPRAPSLREPVSRRSSRSCVHRVELRGRLREGVVGVRQACSAFTSFTSTWNDAGPRAPRRPVSASSVSSNRRMSPGFVPLSSASRRAPNSPNRSRTDSPSRLRRSTRGRRHFVTVMFTVTKVAVERRALDRARARRTDDADVRPRVDLVVGHLGGRSRDAGRPCSRPQS